MTGFPLKTCGNDKGKVMARVLVVIPECFYRESRSLLFLDNVLHGCK